MDQAVRSPRPVTLVGGSGFVGRSATEALLAVGADVTVVDRCALATDLRALGARVIEADVLDEDVALPEGEVVVLIGTAYPRPRQLWTLPLEIAVTTARLLPQLTDRRVTLVSSVEVYGTAPAPLAESTSPVLPGLNRLASWCSRARAAAVEPCPPWRIARVCRDLVALDPAGRWVYALAKLAQEELIRGVVPAGQLTVLRLANVFGVGQHRVVSRLVHAASASRPLVVTEQTARSFVAAEDVGRLLAFGPAPGIFNVGHEAIPLEELAEKVRTICRSTSPIVLRPPPVSDSCGVVDTTRLRADFRLTPLDESLRRFARRLLEEPARSRSTRFIPVVMPPRPVRPDEVADRQQAALWNGALKHGNPWSLELGESLRAALGLVDGDELLLTSSGTAALRLAVVGTVGLAQPGDVAVLPSFTYPATADVLVQLGYRLRFVDVDRGSWNIDDSALERILAEERIRLVVSVDSFGNPCDYDRLAPLCERMGVPLVADSAASLGSTYRGIPVGRQASAHAFSMSFAKVLSSGGSGGAVVFPNSAGILEEHWTRSMLMDELHAVAALDQLAVLDELVAARREIASIYERAVEGRPVVPQRTTHGAEHSYVHWVMRVQPPLSRAALARELARSGVDTKEYFRALHLGERRDGSRLPVTEQLDTEVLALPMSSELTEEHAEIVVTALDVALDSMADQEQLLTEVG